MRIFINYKQNCEPDHSLARALEFELKEKELKVFRDESSLIQYGQSWADRLIEEVEKCDLMLSLVSNASLQSNWVLNEIDYALSLKKLIVPIQLDEIDKKLKWTKFRPRFLDIQHLEISLETSSIESLQQRVLDNLLPMILPIPKESPQTKILLRQAILQNDVFTNLSGELDQPIRIPSRSSFVWTTVTP